MIAPKPAARARRVSLWQYLRAFRRDVLSAQPAHLYRAKMAEFRTPFFRSYLVNQPELVRRVLVDDARHFPKSDRVGEGLRPLLGNSVFLTNGEAWARQRRIIDPAFEGGRLRATFPAFAAAARDAVARLDEGVTEIEPWAARAAADVIFRALFSVPISDALATEIFTAFQAYQRAQPLVNLGAFLPLPRWMPRFYPRRARAAARQIRRAIADMVKARAAEIAAGRAPDDLATKIMTTPDPETGETFSAHEMVDQVAIFFLAGHETSASALAWTLYLLAAHPPEQDAVADEVKNLDRDTLDIGSIAALSRTRDAFREALRLYPPVPMMVRQASRPTRFRDRDIAAGAQIVVSPWHLHRNPDHWQAADDFCPARFATEAGRDAVRQAWVPFSAGRRACPGAGFAMAEGPLMVALVLQAFQLTPEGPPPVPVAHLTVRSKDGIRLRLARRN